MKALYQLYPDQFKLLFFNDLLSGKITEGEARKKFISISPIYFVRELPQVQLHHDSNDPFVPVEFARKLSGDMQPAEGLLMLTSIMRVFMDSGLIRISGHACRNSSNH